MAGNVFEEYAGEYDRWFDEHRDEYLAELSRIREIFPIPDSRCIEVGTGSGRFATPLGIKTGLEPSASLSRMAFGRGIGVIRGRAEALPVRDKVVPCILMVTVICFLDDPAAAFREMHRVLLPGGTLVLAFIERGGTIHERYLHSGEKGRFLSLARFYSYEEIVILLEKSGFTIITSDNRSGFSIVLARNS